ncbi:sugar porter family MFS transporter [Cellulomonas sp. ACRRI]|uniref:sugar porter family MFS transporter n=1 Tax=Cellulomonas sp. ACRRI TaxID=2918188 RepID=UPI0027E0CC5B|nr:sugar porter family MFS transporter [Cellulomonas sp. ACRRI]
MTAVPGAAAPRALPPLLPGPHLRRLDVITVVATFGGLLFGYDTGVINGALDPMVADLGLTPATEGLVTSSLLVGAAIGALLCGRLADRVGRRRTLVVLAVVFFAGALGSVVAPSFEVMAATRFVLGLAVGGASVTVPVYLAELAPTERRGAITGRNEIAIVVGQLAAFVVNAVIGTVWSDHPGVWRYMLAVQAVPAVALFVGMLRMPESPRWLLARGRDDDALAVLRQVRDPGRAAAELLEVRTLVARERADAVRGQGGWSELRLAWVRRLVLIGVGVAVVNQVGGINAVMYYGTQLLRESGFSGDVALVANVLNGVFSVLGMLVGLRLINRVTRRGLLLVGLTGIIASHLMIALCSAALPEGTARSVAVTAFLVLFVGFNQSSVGLVCWVILAELFPLRVRGFAIGLCVFWNWTANAVISGFFPSVVAGIGVNGTFLLFAAVNVLSWLFVRFVLPETRDRSLEQLEEDFRAARP